MNHQTSLDGTVPPDSSDLPTQPDYDEDDDLSAALDAAREGQPARLAGIVMSEKRKFCGMALTGELNDTYRARCFLHLFDEAALNRNLTDLQLLVQAEAHDVARFVEEGTRPLHVVARAAFAPGLTLLLGVGCDPNEADRTGETPLRHWTYSEQTLPRQKTQALAALRVLLAGKANPNIADDAGVSPLFWATSLLPTAAVRTLIEAGANVNALDQEGGTPLTALFDRWALEHPVMLQRKLRLLLASGADVNPVGVRKTPLLLAQELKLGAAERLLRAHGAN
jgi:hypothetical protein